MFTIPIRISGVGDNGKSFEAAGRTITLNRHGARIQASRALKAGQRIRVVNQENEQETEFRVVGPLSPPLDQVGEWGIECARPEINIWDIYFPAGGEESDAHLLMSCRQCRSMSLQSLSLVEVEVLDTAGLLTKVCVRCAASTHWGYPERSFAVESKSYQAAVEAALNGGEPLTGERRKSHRRQAQLPVRVRDYYGEVEISKTENISQDGLCFSSPRTYFMGQSLVVVCPYDPAAEKPEVRARVVRVESSGDRDHYLYGIQYEQQSY